MKINICTDEHHRSVYPLIISDGHRLIAGLDGDRIKVYEGHTLDEARDALTAALALVQRAASLATPPGGSKNLRGRTVTPETDPELARVLFWEAVNNYAKACGGDTSSATSGVPRMNAVAAVEKLAPLLRPPGDPPGGREGE